jgi:ubiquinone/menaquinone biosynthesis C-methylase UbiE
VYVSFPLVNDCANTAISQCATGGQLTMNDAGRPNESRGASDRGQYVLGHSEQELARLERQAEIYSLETREWLRRAGLRTGMRVLDVGCGVGDVSMIAAEMVGSTGTVLGIDKAVAALGTASARAKRAGYDWLRFTEGDLFSFVPADRFDAVIGRFILMHVPEPVAALRHLRGLLKEGAVVAFIEMDISEARAVPAMPLLDRCIRWIAETYRRVGAEPDMGSRLYATYRASGLAPRLSGTTRIESGPDSIVYQFAAQTLFSLLPAMERFGIATAAEVGIDTLAERLRAEAIAGDHCILMPRLIGAWATHAAGDS